MAKPELEFLDSERVRQAIYADVCAWGGDCIYVPGNTARGPVCVTWGRDQQMTWAWLDEYYDEAYAIFDAKDSFKKTVIDEAKLNAFVARIPADC
jgi:hypothetical protein